MSRKNMFEKLCDELVVEDICNTKTTREKLKVKYGNDIDALLTIKAQAQEDDHNVFLATRISLLALVVSTIGSIKSLLPETGVVLIDMGLTLSYLLVIIFLFVKIGLCDKYASVIKWRKYVLVVIDDLIEECKAQDNKQ